MANTCWKCGRDAVEGTSECAQCATPQSSLAWPAHEFDRLNLGAIKTPADILKVLATMDIRYQRGSPSWHMAKKFGLI